MRNLMRSFAVATAGLALLLAGTPAVAAAPLPSPRIVDLEPRVVTLEPRIVDLAPKKQKHSYTVDADVLFAFDSAKLSPDAASVLDGVVKTLEGKNVTKVTITGYTDSTGSTSYNQKLSERRAGSVRSYLKKNVDNSGLHYTSAGKGETHPVASNKTPDGRRHNRRVTIGYSS